MSITKHNFLVNYGQEIQDTLRQAFSIAQSGRPGPVVVEITKEAQQAIVDLAPDASLVRTLSGRQPDLSPSLGEVQQALNLIHKAQRPVILAGHGVILSDAVRELREFAERTDSPVAMTLLGIGCFPASHRLCLGMMGMHGETWVNHAIQQSDLLLAFGMRFDDRVTGNLRHYAPAAAKVHIDIDPSEINKNVKADVALIGDLRDMLRQLLPKVQAGRRAAWLDHIQAMKGEIAVQDIEYLPENHHLYAAHVINDLWRYTGGEALIVTDVGQHQMWETRYFRHEKPRTLITSGGLGTMGFALPAAIGVKCARPEEKVWAIIGDGGFQMSSAELATAAQEQLKLNIAIINNGYLGMVRQWQEFFYDRRYAATPLRNPDFLKLAEAHGLTGLRVTTRAEVEEAMRRIDGTEGTVVVDFCVEQEDSVYPMVPTDAALHEMMERPRPSVLAETGADS